jgi:tRNA U34 2-thiouridine synthase MnmA/TrmU
MGLCFIGKRKFSRFISQYIPDHIGLVKSIVTNDTIGEHRGVHCYTLGQRITPMNPIRVYQSTKALFIAKKDHVENIIYTVKHTIFHV